MPIESVKRRKEGRRKVLTGEASARVALQTKLCNGLTSWVTEYRPLPDLPLIQPWKSASHVWSNIWRVPSTVVCMLHCKNSDMRSYAVFRYVGVRRLIQSMHANEKMNYTTSEWSFPKYSISPCLRSVSEYVGRNISNIPSYGHQCLYGGDLFGMARVGSTCNLDILVTCSLFLGSWPSTTPWLLCCWWAFDLFKLCIYMCSRMN